MTQPISFYVQQAADCAAAAAAATLDNQRDKFLQAQAAWQALADAGVKSQEAAVKREETRQALIAEALEADALEADERSESLDPA